jgi:3D-(3,5/4)-trihydroxycyclohexane-1,2-dione acylhydrolase (decyclizing)
MSAASPKAQTTRLTTAQALVKWMVAQRATVDIGDGDTQDVALFGGVWAIFGHGNVAGLGEALWTAREELPTYRPHNEQAMAHAAIAYAKAHRRKRMMACTTSIGPGAVNLATAAALAHVNRLPVLLLPGDVFASRLPDPVLQQVEDFADLTTTANDTLRPVSRLFDRITRPEQLLSSLPQAIDVLTDPARCGPVTLCLSQDVQAEAYDFPDWLFSTRHRRVRRPGPDNAELLSATAAIKQAKRPLLIAGGGVHYAEAFDELRRFAEVHEVPVAETQAGKGALPWDHRQNVGAIGVTGSAIANELARDADVIVAVGTRLQDFTTGSWALFDNDARGRRLVSLNVQPFDAVKHDALSLVADAGVGLRALSDKLGAYKSEDAWSTRAEDGVVSWTAVVDAVTAMGDGLPTDAQVVGAVNRVSEPDDVVVCAAGGLPGELHKLWRTDKPGGYHLEYGFSCMGYEIAGGLGAKLAHPAREVWVMVGDGSYLMLNSEIATSVELGAKLNLVVLDNRGYGCINRLQRGTGGAPFNNLFDEGTRGEMPRVDFVAHARSLGAHAEHVADLSALSAALVRSRAHERTSVVVIDTDPQHGTEQGGAWWDVPVAEVSSREEVTRARVEYGEHVSRRGK